MLIDDYIVDTSQVDWSVLGEWRWLLPEKFRIIFLTRASELYIQSPDGQVLRLDAGAGSIKTVAESFDAFCDALDDPATARNWLMTPIIDSLTRSGVTLASGQCFGFRMLPIFKGASYGPENRVVTSVAEYFGATGSIHAQLKDLPDGYHIKLIVGAPPQNSTNETSTG